MKMILTFLLLASTPALADSMGPITNNTGIVTQGGSAVGSCLSKNKTTASTSTKAACDKIEGTFYERGSIPLPPATNFMVQNGIATTFVMKDSSMSNISVGSGDKIFVTIGPDGKVAYGEGYTPDAAARAFWEAVGQARCAK